MLSLRMMPPAAGRHAEPPCLTLMINFYALRRFRHGAFSCHAVYFRFAVCLEAAEGWRER